MPSVPQAPEGERADDRCCRGREAGADAAASYFSAPLDAPDRRRSSSAGDAAAMAALPTAVTIVTAAGPDGPAGATANAVTSLSLDPPLMLACLDRGSRTLEIVRARRRASGSACSPPTRRTLARGIRDQGAAHGEVPRGRLQRARGVPILDGAVAWVACGCASSTGGDHEIAVGEVLAVGATAATRWSSRRRLPAAGLRRAARRDRDRCAAPLDQLAPGGRAGLRLGRSTRGRVRLSPLSAISP